MQVETRRSQPSMPEASEPGDAAPPPLVALMSEAAMATERLNAEAPRLEPESPEAPALEPEPPKQEPECLVCLEPLGSSGVEALVWLFHCSFWFRLLFDMHANRGPGLRPRLSRGLPPAVAPGAAGLSLLPPPGPGGARAAASRESPSGAAFRPAPVPREGFFVEMRPGRLFTEAAQPLRLAQKGTLSSRWGGTATPPRAAPRPPRRYSGPRPPRRGPRRSRRRRGAPRPSASSASRAP